MKQAIRDLREMYGKEVDSDEGLSDFVDKEEKDGTKAKHIVGEATNLPSNSHTPAHLRG